MSACPWNNKADYITPREKAENHFTGGILSIKEIFQRFEELLPLGAGLAFQGVIQLLQQLFLLGSKLGRCFHNYDKPVITAAAGIAHLGNALAGKDELLAGLRALGQIKLSLSVQCRHFNFCA